MEWKNIRIAIFYITYVFHNLEFLRINKNLRNNFRNENIMQMYCKCRGKDLVNKIEKQNIGTT